MARQAHDSDPADDAAPTPYVSNRFGRAAPSWAPTAVFAALVLVVGVLVAVNDGRADDGPPVDPETTEQTVGVGGPRDGLESKRHPVEVSPADGLADGQVVTVRGSQFPPNTSLGVVMCSPHGPSDVGGSANCELSPYTSATSDANGDVELQYAVRRHITLPNGTVDCAGPPPEGSTATCVVAVGAISDYDESGIAVVSFDPGLPAVPPPSVEIDPQPPYEVGQELTVTIRDAVPGTTWMVDVCAEYTGEHGYYVCASYESGQPTQLLVGPDGTAVWTLTVPRGIAAHGTRADCADPTVRCVVEVYGPGSDLFGVELTLVGPPAAPTTDTVPAEPTTTVPGTAPTTSTVPGAPPTTAATTTAVGS